MQEKIGGYWGASEAAIGSQTLATHMKLFDSRENFQCDLQKGALFMTSIRIPPSELKSWATNLLTSNYYFQS